MILNLDEQRTKVCQMSDVSIAAKMQVKYERI